MTPKGSSKTFSVSLTANQSFTLLSMPKLESALKTTVFENFKSNLLVYHDLRKVVQKGLYVGASSVVYLHCDRADIIFKLHDFPNLLEKTKEPEMAIPSTTLLDLLNTLKGQAQDDQGFLDAEQLGQKIDVATELAIDILQIV
ncbi:hypothetical protein BGX21_011486 [Mortierella sp. AD011]|nr:hypothetical protein BGX21_011486 [Mortierella sp. AD011]